MGAITDYWSKAFTGLRALVVQNYTEANVKNGLQFEMSGNNDAVAAGGNVDIVFTVGSKPVIVKERIVAFTGTKITAQVFEAPTVTGGTGTTVVVYNLNRISPAATTVSALLGQTVTNNGTKVGADTVAYGGSGVGQSVVSTFAAQGAERILKPNTKYLLRITNGDAAAQKIAVYATWYEGTPDLPEA